MGLHAAPPYLTVWPQVTQALSLCKCLSHASVAL